jgi:catechol 2,3-dioxygenase-like lactoylglutathione lyase family enzyme
MTGIQAAPGLPESAPRFHHVGVQTTDLDNCVSWYQDFFGCRPAWTLSTFSELTLSRLPGIVRLTEMVVGDVRLHLFERASERAGQGVVPGPPDTIVQFQHVCMLVESSDELVRWRRHWIDLFTSGRYAFALPDQPTEILYDAEGIESFYTFDVNGLEYEFTYVPSGAR